MRAAFAEGLAVVLTWGFAIAVAVPAGAAAQGSGGDSEVAGLMAEAAEAVRAGDFERAREAFARAYDLTGRPVFLYDIGMCHRAQGDDVRTIPTFRRYLEEGEGREPPERLEEIRRLVAEMEARGGAGGGGPERTGTAESPETGEGDSQSSRAAEPGLPSCFWVSLGLAGTAAAATAVVGGVMLDYRAEYLDGGRRDAGLYEVADDLRDAADALLAVTAAAGIAALTIWLVSLAEDEPAEPRVVPAPGGIAIRW